MPVGSIGRWYRRYLGMLPRQAHLTATPRLRHVTSGLMPEALAAGQRQGRAHPRRPRRYKRIGDTWVQWILRGSAGLITVNPYFGGDVDLPKGNRHGQTNQSSGADWGHERGHLDVGADL